MFYKMKSLILTSKRKEMDFELKSAGKQYNKKGHLRVHKKLTPHTVINNTPKNFNLLAYKVIRKCTDYTSELLQTKWEPVRSIRIITQ